MLIWTTSVLLLGSVAHLVVNRAVLPRVVVQVENKIAESGRYELSVGKARYFLFGGVRFLDVVLSPMAHADSSATASAVRLEIAHIRVTVPFGAVRRLGGLPELSLSGITTPDVTSALWELLAATRAVAIMPRRMTFSGISVALPRSGDSTAIVISDLEMRYDARNGALSITSTNSSDGAVTIDLQIDLEGKTIAGEVIARALPIPIDQITDGALGGRLSFQTIEVSQVELDGSLELRRLTLALPSIADLPITDINATYVFKATLDLLAPLEARYVAHPVNPSSELPRGQIVFTRGDLEVNGTRLSIVPAFRGLFGSSGLELEPRYFQAVVKLQQTPVQQLLQSMPYAIVGELAQTRVSGTLEWELNISAELDEISGTTWTANTLLEEFSIQAIPRSMNVFTLNDEFVHTIHDEAADYHRTVRVPAAQPASMGWMLMHSEHSMRQIHQIRARALRVVSARSSVIEEPVSRNAWTTQPAVDPEYRYVFVDDLSPWVVRAVLTAEDGDFFFYGGVNPITLADAIEQNIRAGEIRYGASTISMQLVKMLFLGQERLFSRKVQEVLLVYLMEHRVPLSKERILELYLNLAEFGPGVYGIYDGSQYYFDKHPRDLNAGEATWLASILPSPKTYHRYFENGWISDGWFARMIGLYDIMLERGRMSGNEYHRALQNRPLFAQPL